MADVNLSSLKSLMVFKALFENGTATKAAQILGVTQSGVSRSLAQLEANLALPLFIRQKSKLIATPEAHELYKKVVGLMFNLDELKHSIVALREFGASRVQMASIPGLAFGFVPRLVSKLLAVNPHLNIYFDVMSSNDVVLSVEAGKFDIGFVTLPAPTQQLQVDVLVETEAVCILPKGHALAKREHVDLSDLAGQHLVVTNQPNIAADKLLRLVAENNVPIAGKTESNITGINALVGNGVGLAVVNPITASDINHKAVVTRPFTPAITYAFGLVYKKNWAGNKLIELIHQLHD